MSSTWTGDLRQSGSASHLHCRTAQRVAGPKCASPHRHYEITGPAARGAETFTGRAAIPISVLDRPASRRRVETPRRPPPPVFGGNCEPNPAGYRITGQRVRTGTPASLTGQSVVGCLASQTTHALRAGQRRHGLARRHSRPCRRPPVGQQYPFQCETARRMAVRRRRHKVHDRQHLRTPRRATT
jgi:hypothetical protein